MVLGSGLAKCVDILENPTVIENKDIPNWKIGKAIGHNNRLIFGHIKNNDEVYILFM